MHSEPVFELSPADHGRLYQPLYGEQIRLLNIHPSRAFEAEIVCDLIIEDIGLEPETLPDPETGSLEGIVQYEALSYCWGSPGTTKTIQCNDIKLPVTDTLLEALRHIRLSNKPRLLWTDLCCINQDDLTEKARQVQMMFVIFQRAFKVLAWVGTPTEDDMFICSLVKAKDEYERANDGDYHLDVSMRDGLYGSEERDPQSDLARKSAKAFVTSRPFFRRTWIRQEVFAARHLDMICGHYAYPFREFTNMLDEILPDQTTDSHRFVKSDDPEAQAFLCYSYFRIDHDKFYSHTSVGLDDLLFHTMLRSAMYKSTLPQDKVYAVLGILSEQSQTADDWSVHNKDHDITSGFPETDYSKPVSLVYQDFVKHHIDKSTSLKCLSIFQDQSAHGADIPSWAIDLRVNTPRYLCPAQLADWGINYDDQLPEQSFEEHGVLELRGVHIGKIGSQVHPDPWGQDYPRSAMSSPLPMLQSCLDRDEMWFPSDDEAGRQNGNVELEKTFERLRRDCRYSWKAVGKTVAPIGPSQSYRWASKKFHYHALVSDLVREGDAIVHLGGAELAFVLRPSDTHTGAWTLLGPAILTIGVFNVKKMMDGKAVFEHDMAHILDDAFDWEEKAEAFVLV